MKKWLLVTLAILFPLSALAAVGPLVNGTPLTVTSGGTWQKLFNINQNRSTLWIQNPCTATSQGIGATESLFVYFIPFGSTSCLASGTAGAFEISSCGSLVMTGPYVSQQGVCVFGATTSHAFEAAQSQ